MLTFRQTLFLSLRGLMVERPASLLDETSEDALSVSVNAPELLNRWGDKGQWRWGGGVCYFPVKLKIQKAIFRNKAHLCLPKMHLCLSQGLNCCFPSRTDPSSPRWFPVWRNVCATPRFVGTFRPAAGALFLTAARVCVSADVSSLQQQQRLPLALLLLRLPPGARRTRPEPRGGPALPL